MMQKIVNAAMGAVGETETEDAISIAKASVSMVCSDFNAVGEITIPAEAKSAEVLNLAE